MRVIYIALTVCLMFFLLLDKDAQLRHGVPFFSNVASAIILTVMYGCYYWILKVDAVLWHQLPRRSALCIIYERFAVPSLTILAVLRDELLEKLLPMTQLKIGLSVLLMLLLMDVFGVFRLWITDVLDFTDKLKLQPVITTYPPKSRADFLLLDVVVILVTVVFLFGWNPHK